VQAFEKVHDFWEETFREGETHYGFLPNTIPTEEERLQLSRFFFWTAWVASTLRPGTDHTYTNNWPADRSVGNEPTSGVYVWTLGGILGLFVVLGIFIYFIHHYGIWYGPTKGVRIADKLVDMPLTPSQMSAAKYFLVVILLFLLQTSFGGLLAHYTIHPASFYLPIVNDYEHGTYLTMNHGHGALFGVYGMLSIGLLLFSWRGLVDKEHWNNRLLKVSFFGFNVGLLLLTLGTLFPVGVLQAWTSFKKGLWVACDASFFERDFVQFIGTVRIIPDLSIILLGVIPLAYFLFRTYPHLKASEIREGESVWDRLGITL
jgi:nitric oxide reductase large subunit